MMHKMYMCIVCVTRKHCICTDTVPIVPLYTFTPTVLSQPMCAFVFYYIFMILAAIFIFVDGSFWLISRPKLYDSMNEMSNEIERNGGGNGDSLRNGGGVKEGKFEGNGTDYAEPKKSETNLKSSEDVDIKSSPRLFRSQSHREYHSDKRRSSIKISRIPL